MGDKFRVGEGGVKEIEYSPGPNGALDEWCYIVWYENGDTVKLQKRFIYLVRKSGVRK